MNLSKCRKLACAAGILIALSIPLCPHALHMPLCEMPGNPGRAPVWVETTQSHHDHQHCEFDAMHSHEFLVLTPLSFQPPLQLAAISLLNPRHSTTPAMKRNVRVGHSSRWENPLEALDTIRLRI